MQYNSNDVVFFKQQYPHHFWSEPNKVAQLITYDGRTDAEEVYSAMKGVGTNDDKLVNIYGNRTREQRNAIAYAYAKNKGDLIKMIKGDTSGNYETLLCALATPYPIYMAQLFREALHGVGTKESLLIDLLAHQSNYDILEATRIYGILYGGSGVKITATTFGDTNAFQGNPYPNLLREHIKSDTSGNFEDLLMLLCSAGRDETGRIDYELVKKDAHDLYKGGEGRLGTDDRLFVKIFGTRSNAHMVAVSQEYIKYSKNSLVTAIEKETSGDYKQCLVALADGRSVYWAKKIHGCMAGLGTNDSRLIRCVVLNTKDQLKDIAKVYQDLYGKDITQDIKGDTSGNYESLLCERFR